MCRWICICSHSLNAVVFKVVAFVWRWHDFPLYEFSVHLTGYRVPMIATAPVVYLPIDVIVPYVSRILSNRAEDHRREVHCHRLQRYATPSN